MASHREATRLDNLPMEILRRIAAAGPAANVLPAMKTCRSLYGAYFDTLVLKEILENENAEVLEDYGLDVNAIAAYVGDDTRAWIQLAVADERASKRLGRPSIDGGNDAQPQSVQDLTKAFDQFVPSLIALKHPIISSSKTIPTFLQPLWDACAELPSRRRPGVRIPHPNILGSMSPGLAFSLCASTLSCAFMAYGDGKPASKLIGVCASTVEGLVNEGRSNYEGVFSIALAHVALSAWSSLLAIHIDGNGDEEDPRMPDPSRIPWFERHGEETDCLPFPFQLPPTAEDDPARMTVAWDQWYRNRVAYMSDTPFLTDGEWCGYWSFDNYMHDSLSVAFAEAIDSMVLVVSCPRRRSPRLGRAPMRITATYPNSIHNFILEGTISHDGIFDLGPPGDFWVWRGRMTPFGLFGFWGSSDWTRIAGACWLWKRAWCGTHDESISGSETSDVES